MTTPAYPTEIHSQEVLQRMDQGEQFVFVDVREQPEWDEGHIEHSIHIPLGQLEEKYTHLRKHIPLIIVCRSGMRSSKACWFLSEKGYDVTNLFGGIMHWEGDLVQ